MIVMFSYSGLKVFIKKFITCRHTKFETTSLGTPSEGMLIGSHFCYFTVKRLELDISVYQYTKFLGTRLNITSAVAISEIRVVVTTTRTVDITDRIVEVE
jgi:urease beta subunit